MNRCAQKLLLAVFISVTLSSVVFANPPLDEWTAYPQPDKGALFLPGKWVVVNFWNDAKVEILPQQNQSVSYYTQSLINAKQENEGIVCSVASSRMWFSQEGRITNPRKDGARLIIDQTRAFVLKNFPGSRVGPVKSQKGKYGTVWRFDITFGPGGGSRMLEAWSEYKGVLYRLSATYRIEGERHWRSVFERALELWQPGQGVEEIAAASFPDVNNDAWQKISLQNAGTIFIPTSWLVVFQDNPVQTDATYNAVLNTQRCLNVRIPAEHDGESLSTLQILALWPEASGGALLEGDLSDLLEGVAQGLQLSYKSSLRRIEKKTFEFQARTSPMATYEVAVAKGVYMRLKCVALRHDDKVLIFVLTYPSDAENRWPDLMKEIFSRWELVPPHADNSQIRGATTFEGHQAAQRYSPFSPPLPGAQDAMPRIYFSFWDIVLIGTLGATPALIMRFVFKKRYSYFKAFLLSFLFMFLSLAVQTYVFNNLLEKALRPRQPAYGTGITFAISIAVLLKGRTHRGIIKGERSLLTPSVSASNDKALEEDNKKRGHAIIPPWEQ